MEQRIKGKVKGKAIIGIAVAAIMLASLMAVLPGMSADENQERLIIDSPIAIDPVDDVEKAMARLDPSILPPTPIQLPIIRVEQLTLAGTPLKITAVAGWAVEKVLLKALTGEEMMEIEKEHVYQLGDNEIMVVFKQGDTFEERLMKVRVVDRTPPTIGVQKEIISGDKVMHVRISTRDNCDTAPMLSAAMMHESLKCLEIKEQEAKAVMLRIDLNKNEAVLIGPQAIRDAMKATMMEGKVEMYGVGMKRSQEMLIKVVKEKVVTEGVTMYKYNCNYNGKGRNIMIKGSGEESLEMPTVAIKAEDASLNLAEENVMLDRA